MQAECVDRDGGSWPIEVPDPPPVSLTHGYRIATIGQEAGTVGVRCRLEPRPFRLRQPWRRGTIPVYEEAP